VFEENEMENRAPGTHEKRRRNGAVRRFGADSRGSAAIEFALLAVPFFVLVFGIMESCLSFAAGQMLQKSVDSVARQLRTGQILPEDATAARIRSEICNGMSIMLVDNTCPDLFVDLKHYNTFAEIPYGFTRKANGDVNTAGFTIDPGNDREINQLRAFYRWTVMTDLMKPLMENIDKGTKQGKLLMFGTMTWRNEPFTIPGSIT
jgi:Flp pilus assembly protein TadG